jgi:protein SCO1/2
LKKITIFSLLLLGLGGAVALSLATPQPIVLTSGYLFDQPRALADFSLEDQQGKAFNNQDFMGKWSLLFVGYTSCPDVCPTTLSKLAALYPKLKELSDDKFQIVFVSADPARDNQEKRLNYINFFNPEFKAVTAKHEALFPFSRDLGFAYAMVGDGDDYQVDHSASYVLVSPKGEKFAVFKPKPVLGQIGQINNKELLADLEKIFSRYSAS